jgi:hypothetical protein
MYGTKSYETKMTDKFDFLKQSFEMDVKMFISIKFSAFKIIKKNANFSSFIE